MKRTLLTLLSVLFCAISFAQSVPQGINYQAVARDTNGAVLMNQALTIQFSVISDITTSAVSWQETHTVNTNDYGLYTAIIGQGIATSVGSSAAFDSINWGASNHLLKVEVDFGSGYLDMGTTAFMSVPYSIYSANPGPQGIQGVAGNDGQDGVDGIDGTNGTNGVNGAVGATGAQGIQGIAGLNGTNSVCGFSIGDTAYGGVIFYLDATGCHGLVAKATDEPGLYLWSSVYFPVYSLSRGIFAGAHNTKKIIAKTSMQGITCPAATQVSLPYGGFNDWYLPSIDELDMMFVNLHLQGLGGFANNNYWSSTEYNDSYAWKLDFINGHHDYSIKAYTYFLNVRAVRAF